MTSETELMDKIYNVIPMWIGGPENKIKRKLFDRKLIGILLRFAINFSTTTFFAE